MPPVHEHEVHDKVKSSATTPYGCSNAEPAPGYWVLTRLYRGNMYELSPQWIEHKMSTLCRYDKRAHDPKCDQCKLPSDEAYLRSYNLG